MGSLLNVELPICQAGSFLIGLVEVQLKAYLYTLVWKIPKAPASLELRLWTYVRLLTAQRRTVKLKKVMLWMAVCD